MTPRQKYDLATAGWCVVAAMAVYLILAFMGSIGDIPSMVLLAMLSASASLHIIGHRLFGRPNY